MKILVTGGGGFCGQHFIEFIENKGVDWATIGARVASSNHLLAVPTDYQSISSAINEFRPTHVIHLAGETSGFDIKTSCDANFVYAGNILKAIGELGLIETVVLLIGSAAEYGMIKPQQLPIKEDLPPNPYSLYGLTKLAQTQLGLMYSKQGISVCVARPFNIIGPRMPEHLFLGSIVKQIAQGVNSNPSKVFVGNLDCSRDFIGIAQVCEIYWALLTTKRASGRVVNVCCGRPISLRTLLESFIKLTGLSIEIVTDPMRYKQIDIVEHYGSKELLENVTGVKVRNDLEWELSRIVRSILNQ